MQKLFDHLVELGAIRQLDNHRPECLPQFSRDALAKLAHGDPSWESMLPPEVAQVVRDKHAFGYRPSTSRHAAWRP